MTGPSPFEGSGADPARDGVEVVTDLTFDPLDVARAYAAVVHPACGGVGVFVGVVRDHHEGASVRGLTYEAWAERARPALRAVADEVAADHRGVRRIYAAHRLGPLAVGEASVVVAASAPHRDEAFTATRALIDRIKADVPIWKQEHLVTGEDRWPGSEPAGSGYGP